MTPKELEEWRDCLLPKIKKMEGFGYYDLFICVRLGITQFVLDAIRGEKEEEKKKMSKLREEAKRNIVMSLEIIKELEDQRTMLRHAIEFTRTTFSIEGLELTALYNEVYSNRRGKKHEEV